MNEQQKTTIVVEIQVYENTFYKVPPKKRSKWNIEDRTTGINKTLLTLTQEFDIAHAPNSFSEWKEIGLEFLFDDIKKTFNNKLIYLNYY